jgi:hypothetical protein
VGEASQRPQLARRAGPERLDVVQHAGVDGVGGVQLEEAQAGGAQVHAVDRPVVQAGHAEGTAVTHPLGQDLPGVHRVPLVVPGDLEHLLVVVGLLLADAVRLRADPELGVEALHGTSE